MVESDLKKKIIEFIDSAMKNQSKCEAINLDDVMVQKALLQKKGILDNKLTLPKFRGIVKVKWNKEKLYFGCSIVFLDKQKDGKWYCSMRFDDAHGSRHLDVDLPIGRTKIFDGKLDLIKIECPILHRIINSLPKAKADEWKIDLFKKILIGKQKHKEYLKNPNKIHFYKR